MQEAPSPGAATRDSRGPQTPCQGEALLEGWVCATAVPRGLLPPPSCPSRPLSPPSLTCLSELLWPVVLQL